MLRAIGLGFNLLNVLLFGNLPPLGSVCVLVEKDGRYLLVERPGGTLVLPGGFMRWREHPTQTARRECREETGLIVEPRELIGTYANVSKDIYHMSTLLLAYRAEVAGGELRASIEGKPLWLDEEAMRGRIKSFYLPALEDYFVLRNKQQADSLE